MHVDETTLLEEFVDRVRGKGADAEYGLEGVGAGAQMRDRAEVFQRVALFLERVIRTGRTFHRNAISLNFERLLGLGSGNERAFHDEGRAYIHMGDFSKIIHCVVIDNLHRCKESSIRNGQKAESL